MLVTWLEALGGAPVIVPALTAVTWLAYRIYRLKVVDRIHARELAANERMHARRLKAACEVARFGFAATFQPASAAVTPATTNLTAALVLPDSAELAQSPEPSTVTGPPDLAPPLEPPALSLPP
jgi:hypothetical protein